MLPIHIPRGEFWDERSERFVYTKETTLKLEHSLISISKWEAKWGLPFFDTEKTEEQSLDYIRCMTLNTDVDPLVYYKLTPKDGDRINEYISSPMTATTISDLSTKQSKRNSERITSELIYYWMFSFNIPIETEKWHINRLIMLIRVFSEKNKPQKKMTQKEVMEQNKALNAARKAKLNTKG